MVLFFEKINKNLDPGKQGYIDIHTLLTDRLFEFLQEGRCVAATVA
jgi:hypothetical protein